MQQAGDEPPKDWSQIKKPKLSSENRKKQVQSKPATAPLQQEPAVNIYDRIDHCFKYRIASLITQIGKPQYYCTFDPKLKRTTNHNPIKRAPEEQLHRIANQLELSCRFYSRSIFQVMRQPLLKSMGIDIRGVMQKLSNDKEFLKLYEDLDDQSEEQHLRDEEVEKKLEEIERMPETEVKEGIRRLREKHKLAPNQHLFIMQGEFFDIIKLYLVSRGWVEIEDIFSQVYEFKFCYAKKYLQNPIPEQVVNRFQNTKLLTTKYGLARSLKNCYCVSGLDANNFFPKCFDLSDEQDFEDFLEEYKFVWIENYLKKGLVSAQKVDLCLKLLERRMEEIQAKVEKILKSEYPVVRPEEWASLMAREAQLDEGYAQDRITETLKRLRQFDPQYDISLGENIWVVKPVGLSRGRGIKYFKTLEEILAYSSGAKDVNFVVQKCVENIMTIQKRKFDIRQWIILAEVQPLTVYMYSECYIRFCGVEYSADDLKNRYAHLTNFSVQKHKTDHQPEALMLGQAEFAQVLAEMGHNFEDLRKRMIEIIVATLKSAQKSIENRKNTFEIYGLDFIVDRDCKPWLIEINSSPTFGQSTPVTERLVQMGLRDMCEFIVGRYYEQSNKAAYGGWQMIYRQT